MLCMTARDKLVLFTNSRESFAYNSRCIYEQGSISFRHKSQKTHYMGPWPYKKPTVPPSYPLPNMLRGFAIIFRIFKDIFAQISLPVFRIFGNWDDPLSVSNPR